MAEIARWAIRTGTSMENIAIRLGTRHGALLLRLSLGIVFLWFALPKFIPGLSAADPMARKTIGVLTVNMINGDLAVFLLAVLELSIAAGLLTGWFPRLTIAALMFQMVGTLTPLALFPADTWKSPLVLSLEGQFIVKNLVFVAAAITLTGQLRRRQPAEPSDDGFGRQMNTRGVPGSRRPPVNTAPYERRKNHV